MGKVKSRSGSQRRRTTKRINVNCTPEHYAAISKLTERTVNPRPPLSSIRCLASPCPGPATRGPMTS